MPVQRSGVQGDVHAHGVDKHRWGQRMQRARHNRRPFIYAPRVLHCAAGVCWSATGAPLEQRQQTLETQLPHAHGALRPLRSRSRPSSAPLSV